MKPALTDAAILTLVVGMAAINFTQRFVPMAVFSRIDMPRPLLRWLSFIPISVMGSLVATEVLRPGGRWIPITSNPGVYAAAMTALAYRFTGSFLGATVAGIGSFVALRALMG